MARKVVIIVQARLGSTRLPGKVLKEIQGKPMLWQVIERLSRCRLADEIAVATSNQPVDDAIVYFCQQNKTQYFRGSEADVLSRYYGAAKEFKAETIVRITADCPLIDPQVVDRVIAVLTADYDLASNVVKRTYPRGLDTEVFTFNALERLKAFAHTPAHHEHVTARMYEPDSGFKIFSVEQVEDLSALRWTVDEQADFEFISSVYKQLGDKKGFITSDILSLLQRKPELLKINQNVKQKTT